MPFPLRQAAVPLTAIGLSLIAVGLNRLPTECPLLARALIGRCRAGSMILQSPEQAELSRVPHEDIPQGDGVFTVESRRNGQRTSLRFLFRAEPGVGAVWLEAAEAGGTYRRLSLVSHPVFTGTPWSRQAVAAEQLSVYTVGGGPALSLEEAVALPGTVYDAAAAKQLGREGAIILGGGAEEVPAGTPALISTYYPRLADGSWASFAKEFDLTQYGKNGTLSFRLHTEGAAAGHPLRLGEVHVEYPEDLKPVSAP